MAGVTNGLNHSTRMKCGDLIFLHDKREIICFNRKSDPPETAPYNPNNQKRKNKQLTNALFFIRDLFPNPFSGLYD